MAVAHTWNSSWKPSIHRELRLSTRVAAMSAKGAFSELHRMREQEVMSWVSAMS